MQLTDRIHLVGSGALGFGMTDPGDCHVYLIDGGEELALVDAGCGGSAAAIVANVRAAGLDPARIRRIFVTHAHGDHAGGANRLRALLDDPVVHASVHAADLIERADERGFGLDLAKAAGFYPADYRLEPCPVRGLLREGDRVQVGNVSIEVIETPGHADGHVSLLADDGRRRDLLAGDAVFYDGRIMLQATHDSRLDRTIATLRKLRPLAFDGLFAGHGLPDLTTGPRHVARANAILDGLLIPEQLIPATAVNIDA